VSNFIRSSTGAVGAGDTGGTTMGVFDTVLIVPPPPAHPASTEETTANDTKLYFIKHHSNVEHVFIVT
jgi:hypothetical protein